jgi:hypothetical protein
MNHKNLLFELMTIKWGWASLEGSSVVNNNSIDVDFLHFLTNFQALVDSNFDFRIEIVLYVSVGKGPLPFFDFVRTEFN